MATESEEAIAAAVPDYEIEKVLGRGGMGVVFLARHQRLGRKVAIKELPSAFAAEDDVRERFSFEARTLAALSHPHIVPIYDYVERDGLCLIVMEELPGGTVWERFTTAGLTPPTACAIVVACCAALEYAHAKGVLHLDVKPDNLMFDREAAVKVTDFGISRVLGGGQTLSTVQGQVLGTPAYMSPEQAKGEPLTAASDVYSAAVMLYELLSGQLPWTGATTAADLLRMRLDVDPIALVSVAPDTPPGIADVVMRALDRDPTRRYATASTFGSAISEACAAAWGPEWLDYADIGLLGAESTLRTTGRQTGAPGPAAAPGAPDATGPSPSPSPSPATATTVTPPAVDRAAGTTATPAPAGDRSAGTTATPAAAPRTAAETTATPTAHGSGRTAETTATTAAATGTAAVAAAAAAAAAPAAPAAAPPQFRKVRAAGSAPRIEGADLNSIDRSELVAIEDVLRPPPRGRLAFALALLGALGAVVAAGALSGSGDERGDLTRGQVTIGTVDAAAAEVPLALDEDIPLTLHDPALSGFVNGATLELSTAGIPLGSVEAEIVDGTGTFEPGVPRYTAAGSVDAELVLSVADDEVARQPLTADATNPWYATALGIGSILLVLAGLANLESALRPLRKARRRVGAFVGAAVGGAMVGVGGAALATALGVARATAASLVATGLIAALAAVALGFAALRRGRRRRLHSAVRRAEAKHGVRLQRV